MVTGKGKAPLSNAIKLAEKDVIKQCEFLGFGRVMQMASQAWYEKDSHGALLVGTAAGLVEKCGCRPEGNCDWCCGAGWLTKKVKSLKDQS
ncbi:hypothetical protein [Vibrio lentus]|uniref:hypothetical protein n=1 Tax=Vibrio lentus TaxID=136468 RepID=UPI001E62BF08|nr:hypothetical protein [Vibrio lentus]MCC4838004.1 hypothetical protein [Vibrio lentus]